MAAQREHAAVGKLLEGEWSRLARDDRAATLFEFLGYLLHEDGSTSLTEVEDAYWWAKVGEKGDRSN